MRSPEISSEQLAQACYTIRKRMPTLPVLGIQWMHRTNTRDPLHEELLAKKRNYRWLLLPARLFLLVLRSIFLILATLLLRWKFGAGSRFLKDQRIDIVAKSWHFANQMPMQDKDFYYGELQQMFFKRGLSSLLLCGNVGKRSWKFFAGQRAKTSEFYQFPEFCLVTSLCIVRVFFEQIVSCFGLWKLRFKEKDSFLKTVLGYATVDCLRTQTMTNCLYYWIGRRAIRLWKPKAFLTLYEGYAWEKCLWRGVKTEDSVCKTIGYQHTVILQRTLALRKPCLNPKEYSTPDIVLSSGYKIADILKKSHAERKTKVIPFGSFRCQPSLSVEQPSNSACRTVLVVSDWFKEAPFLFNTAMKTASILKDHHFIFRLHPIDPFSKVKPYLNAKVEAFPNIEISKQKKIEEDFVRSSAILYRGSSAVLYAILNGLKPFYLHKAGMEIIDPIFELNEWRQNVESEDALEQGLLEYAKTPAEKNFSSWKVARDYVQAYTMPVDQNSIDRLLMVI